MVEWRQRSCREQANWRGTGWGDNKEHEVSRSECKVHTRKAVEGKRRRGGDGDGGSGLG